MNIAAVPNASSRLAFWLVLTKKTAGTMLVNIISDRAEERDGPTLASTSTTEMAPTARPRDQSTQLRQSRMVLLRTIYTASKLAITTSITFARRLTFTTSSTISCHALLRPAGQSGNSSWSPRQANGTACRARRRRYPRRRRALRFGGRASARRRGRGGAG